MNITRTLIFSLILLLFTAPLSAQTWEQVLKKAEKQYSKGKYHKAEKITRKLREKHIAKKFNGDSSLHAFTYVMDAKATLAMSYYEDMLKNLDRAAVLLEKYKAQDPYNYIMPILRIVDIYNEYGNHLKADSVTAILENLESDYNQNELLINEIKIRRALTDVALGKFTEGLELTKELNDIWSTKLRLSYKFEPLKKEDEIYKTQLLVKLYANEVEALREKGEYLSAIELLESRNKQVNRLVSPNTEAFVAFRTAEIKTYSDYKDYKQALKKGSRLLANKLPGILARKPSIATMEAANMIGEWGDAFSLRDKLEKMHHKSKVNNTFGDLHDQSMEAIIDSYEQDPEKNIVVAFNSLVGRVKTNLPSDHHLISLLTQRGIDYIFDVNRSENLRIAEKFYLNQGESLKLRYGPNSLHTDIFKVNFAGYYLKYSETPSKAYSLLAGEVYKTPLSELSTHHPKYAGMVSSLMDYFTLTGNFDYPIALTKSVLEAMKANENTLYSELGEKLVELARLQIQGGYYQEAEENTDEALKILRRGGEKKSEEYVKALNSAAYLYGTIGLYDKAERQLSRAQSTYDKLVTVNQELRLQSIVDLAFLNTRMGNYSETEELLDEVITENRKLYGEQSRRMIKPYRALGEVYLIKGDYPAAEKNLRKALSITEYVFGDTTLIFAESLSKMAKLYFALGNYEAALVNATDVLKIREKALRKNHILFADTYTDLGKIHTSMGSELSVVESYFQMAKEVTEDNFDPTHPLYAEALKNLAYVHVQKQEYDQALLLLDQADEIWRDALANQNKSSGEVARIKGDIYSYQGNFKKARREYEKASRFFKKIFSEEHPDYLNTQSRLARAYYINDEINQVESILSETTAAYMNYTKTYFPTLSEDEKAKFWNKIKPDFEFYNTVAIRYSERKEKYLENMYDFALATKGLLLNSSIKTRNSILNSGDEELITLFKEWIAKKEFLTTTLAKSADELNQNGIDPNKLKNDIELLEKQLSEKSDDFESSFEYKLYSWSDIRKSLNDNEAAVEIVRYREFDERFNEDKIRYAALIITSETRANPELVLLKNGLEMETKHFKYHRNVTKYKLPDDNSFGVFWEPIYNRVKDKAIVYLSPDGVYNQINVESLKVNDTEYVIDKMNVRVVGNTKSIAALRSREGKKVTKKAKPRELSAMLLGNPNYYSNEKNRTEAQGAATRGKPNSFVPQLPGTEKEVNTINQLLLDNGWKIESYLGINATEDQIKQAQNYTLIHIATHGFFDDKSSQKKKNALLAQEDDNPLERAGLITEGGGDVLMKATKNYNIEDGVLTAHEAMNLNFEQTELIILSACETGRGEIQQGEGVFGLQRSFLVAGADAIVMSLYQVSDEVTQMLMVEFYKNWLAGQDKRTAFNNAQLTIKESYSDPIYWGAFTMIAKS